MQQDGFDPGELEHSLEAIARLWLISLLHVGFNRPIHIGPVGLRLTLFVLSAPFLLAAVNRLRRAPAATEIRRQLGVALVAGVLSYISGVVWGDVAMLISLGAMVGAVFLFEGAMHHLTAEHAAGDLARQWQRLRRSTAAAGVLFAPAAVLVLGGFDPGDWLVGALVLPATALAGYLLLRLAEATRRTRSWLRLLDIETASCPPPTGCPTADPPTSVKD